MSSLTSFHLFTHFYLSICPRLHLFVYLIWLNSIEIAPIVKLFLICERRAFILWLFSLNFYSLLSSPSVFLSCIYLCSLSPHRSIFLCFRKFLFHFSLLSFLFPSFVIGFTFYPIIRVAKPCSSFSFLLSLRTVQFFSLLLPLLSHHFPILHTFALTSHFLFLFTHLLYLDSSSSSFTSLYLGSSSSSVTSSSNSPFICSFFLLYALPLHSLALFRCFHSPILLFF